jgi:hypothetical protein
MRCRVECWIVIRRTLVNRFLSSLSLISKVVQFLFNRNHFSFISLYFSRHTAHVSKQLLVHRYRLGTGNLKNRQRKGKCVNAIDDTSTGKLRAVLLPGRDLYIPDCHDKEVKSWFFFGIRKAQHTELDSGLYSP